MAESSGTLPVCFVLVFFPPNNKEVQFLYEFKQLFGISGCTLFSLYHQAR